MTGQLFTDPVVPKHAAKSAVIDGPYRYELRRVWNRSLPIAVFCGMNASKADALRDDMTITKEMQYAVQLGAGTLLKVNRYGWRSTDPDELVRARSLGQDIVGPENLAYINAAVSHPDARWIVAAWGGHPLVHEGGEEFAAWLARPGRDVLCLGRTRAGDPRHPSRLPYSTPFEVYASRTRRAKEGGVHADDKCA